MINEKLRLKKQLLDYTKGKVNDVVNDENVNKRVPLKRLGIDKAINLMDKKSFEIVNAAFEKIK